MTPNISKTGWMILTVAAAVAEAIRLTLVGLWFAVGGWHGIIAMALAVSLPLAAGWILSLDAGTVKLLMGGCKVASYGIWIYELCKGH